VNSSAVFGLVKKSYTISTIFRKKRENCLHLQWYCKDVKPSNA